jgi:Sulfotransferase domain
MRKPNFFILGAAKCGTTSLWYYLGQHPEIFLCRPKEPGFFFRGKKAVAEPADYFSLFDAAGDRRIIGEASPSYLSCPETPELIRLLCPEAKFIITVRHPADRAHSLYYFMRALGLESAQTFDGALKLEPRRISDEGFRRNCTFQFEHCLYFRSGLFGEQAQRYLRVFDRNRFYFLTLDRLKRESLVVVREIFAFLGVTPEFTPDLSRKYTSLFTSRNAPLHHWWRQRIWRRFPRARNRWPINALTRLEWKYNICSIPPIDPGIRKKLSNDYRDDLRLFSQLTGLKVDPDGRW